MLQKLVKKNKDNELPFKISKSKLEKAKKLINQGKKATCCAYGCSNEAVYKKGYLCHKHYYRKMRKLQPIKVRYMGMKSKAKERGIPFTITMEEFERFCHKTGYIVNKGYRGRVATIDRRCNAQGYHIWNIQIMGNKSNIRKGNKGSDGSVFSKPKIADEDDDLPF